MHIAVAGNIGSGKTTLTKLLAHRYGWTPRFEPVDNNPYLADFYADMPRWSFNLQIYFLSKRFKEVVEISKSKEVIIQDRTIFEDACIFAPNLHGQGMMSDRDFENYSDLFELMMSLVRLPDLMIYIRSSIPTLVAQIQKRGREYEQTMRLDYLQGLEKRYEDWISTYKGQLIIVDGDHCKFGENAEIPGDTIRCRYPDIDAGRIVRDRIVDIFQVLFRAHFGVDIDELAAVSFNLCLCRIAFIDEPGLVAGFVDAVYSATCEIVGNFVLGLTCERSHAHCHQSRH